MKQGVNIFEKDSRDMAKIKEVIDKHQNQENPSLEDILAADKWARENIS